MRIMTANTTARKDDTSAAPVTILRLDLGGAVGTKYYADQSLGRGDASSALDAQARVVSWGPIVHRAPAAAPAPLPHCRIVLQDADGVLKCYLGTVAWQRCRATLYQYFAGLAENDLQVILAGVVQAPVAWMEANAVLNLDITDCSALYGRAIGTLASRADLPFLAPGDEGRVLPLVFGEAVRRVRAISCQGGAVTELARRCGEADTQLIVTDASRFPQETPIRIRIDGEVIEGAFAGNTFHVTRRGADLATGTVTGTRDAASFYDRNLSSHDQTYRSYWLRVTNPAGQTTHHYIHAYSGTERCLCYLPQTRQGNGELWVLPIGQAYTITSWARPHAAGARVFYGAPDFAYTFIVNDAASTAVRTLEAYGRTTRWQTLRTGAITVEWMLEETGWFVVEPSLYTVNRNDVSIYGPEHPVTTVTFARHPVEFYPGMSEVTLWATLDGVEDAGDGTGRLVTDPSEVIRLLLERWAGVPPEAMDADSFARARADGTEHLRFGFALREWRPALALAADLAFQARCVLLWEDGRARLHFLRGGLGTPTATLDRGRIVLDSVVLRQTPLDAVATEVRARFQGGEREEYLVLRDAEAEARYGRRVRELDLWAHNVRDHACAVAAFWLERWKRIRQLAEVRTFLTGLALQRHDVVALDHPLFAAGQKARVLEVRHRPGSGERSTMDEITLALELPVGPGCTANCETACEASAETGCYTACESSPQSCWACETSCQDLCELGCTTSAEIQCISYDLGCGSACQTACQAWCESQCETGQETDCGACETTCESACQTACTSSCEEACQTGCETACQVGCEVACQSGCEAACETTCQTTCETSCQVGCETACQTGCQVTCETGCETACQTSCETACQTGCETACETGCETACETGCETSQETSGIPNTLYCILHSDASAGSDRPGCVALTRVSQYKWEYHNNQTSPDYVSLEWWFLTDPEDGVWRFTVGQNWVEVQYPADDPRGHYGLVGQAVNGTIDYENYTLRLENGIYCWLEQRWAWGNTTCAGAPSNVEKYCDYSWYYTGYPLDGRCFRNYWWGNPTGPFRSTRVEAVGGPYEGWGECEGECY